MLNKEKKIKEMLQNLNKKIKDLVNETNKFVKEVQKEKQRGCFIDCITYDVYVSDYPKEKYVGEVEICDGIGIGSFLQNRHSGYIQWWEIVEHQDDGSFTVEAEMKDPILEMNQGVGILYTYRFVPK